MVQEYIDRLMAEARTQQAVESFLLRLNDLPGYFFRAALSLEGEEEPAVKLILVPTTKGGKGL